MEQDAIFEVGAFDRNEVDLNKPASTVKEYIKQVIVSREKCPDVVVAENVDRSKFKKQICLVPKDESVSAICSFTPPIEWSQLKVDNFSVMRTTFEDERDASTSKLQINLPGANDSDGWISFCLATRSPDLIIDEASTEIFSHHTGTPPTLSLLMKIPDNSVNFSLLYLTNHFVQKGYDRALAEWIFSLLLAVKKPLIHDVCSALRQMARSCRLKRAKLTADDIALVREYTFFIAIVSLYFGQKDLADK